MKLLRPFLILALLTLSNNIFATEMNQNILAKSPTPMSKSDIQWLFKNDGLNFLTKSPADYVQLQQDYEKIYFQNNCNSRVAIVARYRDLDNSWVTDGPWNFTPGEKGYVFDTQNAIFYFYGVSESGQHWQGDHIVVINGYNVPMLEVRMSISNWGTYTINLNCR